MGPGQWWLYQGQAIGDQFSTKLWQSSDARIISDRKYATIIFEADARHRQATRT
jgi:hypothetical protein